MVPAVRRIATEKVDGGVCFALELDFLHPDRRFSAATVTADAVALVTSLEGHIRTRFVIQTVANPDVDRPEKGTVDVAIIAVIEESSDVDVDELCDDLLDVLTWPPLRWSFSPVAEAERLQLILKPFDATSFAEIARREEPCPPHLPRRTTGFIGEPGTGTDGPARDLWSMWTLGPATADFRRVTSVLLAQEAPICVRTILEPTALTDEERSALEGLTVELDRVVADGGQWRSALVTLQSILTLRPLFDVRCTIASPDRLSRSMLSALGHSMSEPADHTVAEPALRGGFVVLRQDAPDGDGPVERTHRGLSASTAPAPTLAGPELARIRHVMGAREAANLFRIPVADDDRFPGLETIDVPDLTPPVSDLPHNGHRVGKLIGHGELPVFLEDESRFRHTYVVGQTGTGKSTLLLNMALQDIEGGDGVAILDPHGDLVEDLLARIPTDRIDDVVLLDPADPIGVVGVNLLEAESQIQAAYLVEELSAMFQRLFDPSNQGIVGPRYISMLRQAARLLMSNPDTPGSLLDLPTIYSDPGVRKFLVSQSNDPMAMEYWAGQELASRSNEYGEVLAWFNSKFDAFRASDLVRRVLGQASSTISFSEILDTRKILLVNLSKGLLGSYNSALVGYVVFTRLWAAALERASIPQPERLPFHIYVDEFQNMTSESLPTVLSEARKFRVSLTLANQFFTQIPDDTREAIMGNIGSRLTMRLGPRDAALFAEWMGNDLDEQSLLSLPNHVALVALSRRGVPLPTFAARTDAPTVPHDTARADLVRERSRLQWARGTAEIDADFAKRWVGVPGSFAARAAAMAEGAGGMSNRGTSTGSSASSFKTTANSGFVDDWLAKRNKTDDQSE